ncbi:MAG: hypothetical protein RI958_126 [Actinomycetota bacterium]|jgi:Tfp pilus assembly protein PilW
MKTRVAAVLSIAGVLVAGSAAAMVNTQVLHGSAGAQTLPATSPTSTTTAVAAAASTVPASTVAPSSSLGASSTTAPSTQAIYKVGDSGTVTLDTVGDVLTIVSVEPGLGWRVDEAEVENALEVEITFESDTLEVTFRAALLFGVVTTSVETEAHDDHDDGYDDHDDDDDHDEDHG